MKKQTPKKPITKPVDRRVAKNLKHKSVQQKKFALEEQGKL